MASTCISSCTDTVDRRALVPRHVSLYNWPESSSGVGHARPVDSVSCRQIYLRSYTFSRKQTLQERTKKCFDKVRVLVINRGDRLISSATLSFIKMKAMDLSSSAILDLLRRIFACRSKIDVVDHGDH